MSGTFSRHVPADMAALLTGIERERILLAQASALDDKAAELEHMTALGHQLFVAGRESEAAPLLDEALELARRHNNRRAEIEVLRGSHPHCYARRRRRP